SAPDIAGEDKADPRAMILTAANMLEWMGKEDDAAAAAANLLRHAVEQDLAMAHEMERTTAETGRAIARILQSS
ncbi:MAG: isocitrate/isopropylmalate family dehydrogenase, partial [Desulfuromonadales bacterium]